MRHWTTGAFLLALLAGPLGCGPKNAVPPPAPVLRVGLAPDSPPIAFRQAGRLAGIEVELATQLAGGLGRPLRFVEMPWNDLIPALLDKHIDIIMSGMTVTSARQFRIAFGDPYLKSGLAAMMRRGDVALYDTPAKVLASSAMVGVKEGTTGEKFARERMPNAIVSLYPTSRDAVIELKQRRIDLFINDLPLVGWYVSANESELALLRTLLTNDELAWGFRPTDDALRTAANGLLARWREDGTLSTILRRWLRTWPTPL